MSALSHPTRDSTPGVPLVTQLGGVDEIADEEEEEPTVLQSTHSFAIHPQQKWRKPKMKPKIVRIVRSRPK